MDIDKKGHYSASVESKGGRFPPSTSCMDTKGQIPVKKYKSNKKMAQATGSHLTYASFALPQGTGHGTVEIGYSYVDDDGNEEIYWVPGRRDLDGDTGAVTYVPLNS